MSLQNLLPALAIMLLPHFGTAQVKIGMPGIPDPAAVLELADTARGFLLPRMSGVQMTAIAAPPDGLLVYNQDKKSIYQFKTVDNQWKPIVADSSEWAYDSATTKLYFRRGLAVQDSIYYHTTRKKFLFADTRFYKLSTGGVFNLDEGNSDKFIFKTTASRFYRDPVNLNSANMYSIYEVDNDTIALNRPFEATYNGLGVDATVIKEATQKISALYGVRSFTSHAGIDSISVLTGFWNVTTARGKGFAEVVTGINNSLSVRDSVVNVGLVYGINNTISYNAPSAIPRIAYDLYGYHLNISGTLNGKVDGSAYGLMIRNVAAAGPNRNFAVFTSKGANRFGDSVLVTDVSATRPRAVLDVNATSAMILPAGNTVQRPVTVYPGMLRYNNELGNAEVYTAAGWTALKSPVLAVTASLDIPAVAAGSVITLSYPVIGAQPGNTVTISPEAGLPAGINIAWARVSAANTVEIAFGNFSGTAIDPAAQNFSVKIIQ